MIICKNTGRHKNKRCKLFYNMLYANYLQAKKNLEMQLGQFITN